MTHTAPITLRYHRLADGQRFVYRFHPSDIVIGTGGPLFDALYAQVLRDVITLGEMYEVCWAAWQFKESEVRT